MKKRYLLTGTAALALLAVGAPAQAQEQEDEQVTLDTVTVTSTKRETTLQDTPVTVSVISADTIANSGATEVNELFEGVPGLALIESPAELPVPRIRGIGSSSANQTFEQSVGLFLDGIYKPRAQQYTDSLFDVERVEIIRGAQGVVFGKNTSVGAVSVVSKKPGDEFGGEVYARYETEFESYQLGGAIDLPASDVLKFRLGAQYSETGGFVENVSPDVNETDGDNDRLVVRGTAVLDPGNNWDATLMLQHSDVETVGNHFQLVELFETPFSAVLDDEPFIRDVDGLVTIAGFDFPREGNQLDSTDAALTVNFEINDALTLTSLTSYSEFEYANQYDSLTARPAALGAIVGLPPTIAQLFDEDFQQFTQEFRFDYQGDGVDVLGGVFFQDQELTFVGRTPVSNLVIPLGLIPPATPVLGNINGVAFNTLEQDTQGWSAFAQVGYDITDRLHVDAGARYSVEEKSGVFTVDDLSLLGLAPGFPSPDPSLLPTTSVYGLLTPTGTVSAIEDDPALDGAITLSYDLTDDWLLTLSAAQGTKSAGFNNSSGSGQVSPDPFTVAPEVAQTIEAGLKGTFADGRGYLAGAIFHTQIEDHQVSVFDPNSGVAGAFVTKNIDATSQGLEVEGLFQATNALTLNGNFALLEAENDETGGRLNAAPEFTAAIGADYSDDLTEAISLQLGGALIHSSGYLFRETPVLPAGTPVTPDLEEIGSGEYSLANAYAGVTFTGSDIQLRFDVRNLTDERYVTFAYPYPIYNAGLVGTFNRPRTYEFSVRVPF